LIELTGNWVTVLTRGFSHEELASLEINRDSCCTVIFIILRQHYVLSSVKLDEAIKTEVPVGSSKAQVINFVQMRQPVAYDDMGMQVKARLQGLAANMIYRKDIVITFDFSADGKLLSYSTKEYLTFF
jgi:hypothetical protein